MAVRLFVYLRKGSMKAKCLTFTLVVCAVTLLSPTAWAQVYFDDSDTDTIKVGNSYYEVRLLKANGSIRGIVDKSSGHLVSSGTSGENLWQADTPAGSFGGARTSDAGPDSVSYTWNAATGTLLFTHVPNHMAGRRVPAEVSVFIYDQPYFDLKITVENKTGVRLDVVQLPYDLRMRADDLEEAILPINPGVKLVKKYFEERRTDEFIREYPPNFADYIHLLLSTGSLAMYGILEEDLTPSVQMLLRYQSDDTDDYTRTHAYTILLSDGETWTSPRVRIRIGQSELEVAEGFREDTDLGSFPSLKERLGNLYDGVAKAHNVALDVSGANPHLSNREAYRQLWNSLPPSILNLIGHSFDDGVPDWYPYDSTYGTDKDLRVVIDDARDAGHLTRPYTNWMIWKGNSATMEAHDKADVVVRHEADDSFILSYTLGGHDGVPDPIYLLSPYAPSVLTRIQQMIEETQEASPFDLLYADVLGAGGGLFLDPNAPSSRHYQQGWLEVSREYKDLLLIPEGGHDRLLETCIAINATLLDFELQDDESLGDLAWGSGTWEYYPIVIILAHDKALFEIGGLITQSKEVLTYQMAMGNLVNSPFPGASDMELFHSPVLARRWLNTAAAFQRHVIARYLDERMTDYVKVSADVTRSQFETHAVLTNWSKTSTYEANGHTLASDGFLVTCDAGDLTAGIFTGFNGQTLSQGDHYLIVRESPDSLVVHHPLGDSTQIRLDLQPLTSTSDVRCYAIAEDRIYQIPFTVDGQYVELRLEQTLDGLSVNRYLVTTGPEFVTTPLWAEPGNDTVVDPGDVRFLWRAAPGVTSYELQAGNDTTFSGTLTLNTTVADTVFVPTDLESGTTYFWRIRGIAEPDTSYWSSIRRFRVTGSNTADRLVAHYPLDGSAEDATGALDGIAMGDLSAGQDQSGNAAGAYSFDGAGDYIALPDSGGVASLQPDLTFSAWVYPEAYGDGWMTVFAHDRHWHLRLESGRVNAWTYGTEMDAPDITSTDVAVAAAWSHVAFTYDTNHLRIYVNGKLSAETEYQSTSIGSGRSGTGPMLGKGLDDSWDDFNGLMDDVRFYDRALSAEEIAQLQGFPDIVGAWLLTAIGSEPYNAANSTWTFKGDGTYDWFLSIPPLHNEQGTGTYTVRGDTVHVDGAIADLGTPFVVVTLGDGTFSFLDDEAEKWIYQKGDPPPKPEPPAVTDRTPDFNGDGSVNFNDFIAFAQKYGSGEGDADYDAKYDLDGSNDIGFIDFVQFAQAYGKPVASASGFDLVGTWKVTSIANEPPYGGENASIWTVRGDGTYDWSFVPFEWAGSGNWSLSGSTLTVSGILAQTIGGGTTVELTLGEDGDSFSFPDPDGDVWIYRRQQ